jgi:hypothetical protein
VRNNAPFQNRSESGQNPSSQIEAKAFHETGLVEVIIPASIEILSDWCLIECKSLFIRQP